MVDDLLDDGRGSVVVADDLVEPRPLHIRQTQRSTDAIGCGRGVVSCCRYEARVRSDEKSERGRGVVHDPHARPQLADRSTPLLGCQRGPRLVQVLASNLLGHDPVMTLDRAHPEDLRVSDLGRQRAHERDLGGHAVDD